MGGKGEEGGDEGRKREKERDDERKREKEGKTPIA